MSNLVTLAQLEKKEVNDILNTVAGTMILANDLLKKCCIEPQVIAERGRALRMIKLTAYYIVPEEAVSEFGDEDKYVVIRHRFEIPEEVLENKYATYADARQSLVEKGQHMQQEILSKFADQNFTSFVYNNVPTRLKVIDLKKLDKVS